MNFWKHHRKMHSWVASDLVRGFFRRKPDAGFFYCWLRGTVANGLRLPWRGHCNGWVGVDVREFLELPAEETNRIVAFPISRGIDPAFLHSNPLAEHGMCDVAIWVPNPTGGWNLLTLRHDRALAHWVSFTHRDMDWGNNSTRMYRRSRNSICGSQCFGKASHHEWRDFCHLGVALLVPSLSPIRGGYDLYVGKSNKGLTSNFLFNF